MKKEESKATSAFHTKEVVVIAVLTCVVSFVMGLVVSSRGTFQSLSLINDSSLSEFIYEYEYILDNYYEDVNKDILIKSALEGMVNSLGDRNSTFIDEDSSDTFNINLQGWYQGVGIEVVNDSDGNIFIVSVFDDSPAFKAGLEPLDQIIAFDQTTTEGLTTTELVAKIKAKGTGSFTLTVLRDEEQIEVTLKQETITLQSVYSDVYELEGNKIGYLGISIFAENTNSQFKTALASLEKEAIDGLVLDLRDNTGGHLTSVVKMISAFLDSSHVIFQMESKTKTEKTYSTGKTTKDYPIVILVNDISASASEVMAVALQEEYGAILVGQTTYGKGTVQELKTLSTGEQYKVTTKKWLTPKGNWIEGLGITPDVEVELSDTYYDTYAIEDDNQLQTAFQLLLEQLQ